MTVARKQNRFEASPMRLLPRRASVTLLTALAVLCGFFLVPSPWAQAMGIDVMGYQSAVDTLRVEQEREQALLDAQEQMLYEAAECDAAVRGFAEGRISFAATVDRIDDITRDRPNFEDELCVSYARCPTHRDRIVHFTIVKIQGIYGDDPSKLAEVMTRVPVR